MQQELIVAHEAFHWLDFMEGLATVFFAGLAAWIPYVQWRDKKHAVKVAEAEKALKAQWESEQAAKIKYVTQDRFDSFDKKNETDHQQVRVDLQGIKAMTAQALLEFGDTHQAVNDLAVKVGSIQGGVDILVKLAQNQKQSQSQEQTT